MSAPSEPARSQSPSARLSLLTLAQHLSTTAPWSEVRESLGPNSVGRVLPRYAAACSVYCPLRISVQQLGWLSSFLDMIQHVRKGSNFYVVVRVAYRPLSLFPSSADIPSNASSPPFDLLAGASWASSDSVPFPFLCSRAVGRS